MFKTVKKGLKIIEQNNFKLIFDCLGDYRDLISLVLNLPAFLVINYPTKLDLQYSVVQPEY